MLPKLLVSLVAGSLLCQISLTEDDNIATESSVATVVAVEPPEGRIRNISSAAVGAGALAAGAGLAWLHNYWKKPSKPSYPTYITKYPSSSQYYYTPHKPTTNYYNNKPSQHYSTYYSSSYPNTQFSNINIGNQQNQGHPPYYQYNPQQPLYYYQLQQQQQQHSQFQQQQQHSQFQQQPHQQQPPQYHQNNYTAIVQSRENELLEAKKLSNYLAGAGGLAAGYYLLNKDNQHKNNQNTYTTTYTVPYSQYSYPYYYSNNQQPHYYRPSGSHYIHHPHQYLGHRQGHSIASSLQGLKSRANKLVYGGLGLAAGAAGYLLANKYTSSRPVYTSYNPPIYYPSYYHHKYPQYYQYHPSQSQYQHYLTSTKQREIPDGDFFNVVDDLQDPDGDTFNVVDDLQVPVCVPVHVFTLFGNHYYKCQGKFKFYVHPTDAEI